MSSSANTKPSATSTCKKEKELTSWDLFLGGLSIYVLVALTLEMLLPLTQDIRNALNFIDTAICILFLGDFFWRLWRSENKLQFLKWGWIDFFSSIPSLDIFRWGRLFRLFRILRLIRSAKILYETYKKSPAQNSFLTMVFACFLFIDIGAILILHFEQHAAESNIQNAYDAFWWAFVTMTTVGYGDYYPVTPGGRVIASILMTVGIGLFGSFTAFLAMHFSSSHTEQTTEPEPEATPTTDLQQEINQLRQEISALRVQLSQKSTSQKE